MREVEIKNIYNTFLRVSRKKQDKPYKTRINFDNFETNPNYPYLIKLKNFFERNYIVNIDDFFAAPYEVYKDESYFGLDFYISQNAIKTYTIFTSHKNNLDPDSDIQIETVLRGLKFIKEFCVQHKLSLRDYLSYKEEGDVVNRFIVHLKEKNVSVYNLFALTNFDFYFSKTDYQTLKFILGDTASRLSYYRTKFYSSKKNKLIAVNGLTLIEKEIKKYLEKP